MVEKNKFIFLFLIIVLFAIITTVPVKAQTCRDGTLYGKCSLTIPKYCDNGRLVDKCSTCGCPSGTSCYKDKCISQNTTIKCNYNSDCPFGWECQKELKTKGKTGMCVIKKCPDGTPHGECSSNNLYCQAGAFIYYCQKCGCPTDYIYTCQTDTTYGACKLATCTEAGGDICEGDEYCPGNLLNVFFATNGSYKCCSEQCVLPTWDLCGQCGSGLFNICDRTECNSITENCYFINSLISGSCSSCNTVTCEDYDDDETTCLENHCNLANCSWKDNTCMTCIDNDKDSYYIASKCSATGSIDCDDSNFNINPSSTEICGNGVDENCDGVDNPCLCLDGTLYGECSSTIPKYCDNGQLINNCQQCGCPSGQECKLDGSCITTTTNQTENLTIGFIYATSNPSDTFFYVDNSYKGATPLTVGNIIVGSHSVKFVKINYNNYTTTVYVYAGQTTNVSVTLTPVPTNQTNVTIACSDGTLNNACSITKPKYCQNGTLINKCSTCSCQSGQTCQTDGSCLSTAICTDSDGGKEPYIKGAVSVPGAYTKEDTCQNSSTLIEYVCTTGDFYSLYYIGCSYGCSDGVCLSSTNQTDSEPIAEASATISGAVSLTAKLISFITGRASDVSGDIPLKVEFTGSVKEGDPPFAYFWDFKDGTTSTSQNPQHTYTTPGTYSVLFRVTDADGDISVSYAVVNVNEVIKPTDVIETVSSFADGSKEKEITIDEKRESETIHVKIPKDATVTEATIDITSEAKKTDVDVGNDGDIDISIIESNKKIKTPDLSPEINEYIEKSKQTGEEKSEEKREEKSEEKAEEKAEEKEKEKIPEVTGEIIFDNSRMILIPLTFYTDTPGTIKISDININYIKTLNQPTKISFSARFLNFIRDLFKI